MSPILGLQLIEDKDNITAVPPMPCTYIPDAPLCVAYIRLKSIPGFLNTKDLATDIMKTYANHDELQITSTSETLYCCSGIEISPK